MEKKFLKRKFATLLVLTTFMFSLFSVNSKALAAEENSQATYIDGNEEKQEDAEEQKDCASNHQTGLNEPTEEEKKWIDENSIKITDVSELNKYEIKNDDTNKNLFRSANVAASIPSKFDLTTNEKTFKYFPEIGDQVGGCCVSYANTYYCMSYMINKSLGRKASVGNTMNPHWTYNLTNSGKDSGSSTANCLKVLKEIGGVTNNDLPILKEEDSNIPNAFTDYYTKPELDLYEKAKKYQIKDIYTIQFANDEDTPITSSYDSNLDVIKKILSDGNILSFGTSVYDFNYNKLKTHPGAPGNIGYSGQKAVYSCDGTKYGGHEMTLVGYDDDIWVDVNNDGRIDSGEMGAFKIANSWGTKYQNYGFVWVSYDALNKISAVSGYKGNGNRRGIFSGNRLQTFSVKNEDEKQKLYLEMTLDTNDRESLRISINNGDFTDNDELLYPFCQDGFGGYDKGLALDGNSASTEGKISYDLASINPDYTIDYILKNGLSVKVEDMSGGNSYIRRVKEIKLKDEKNGKEYKLESSDGKDYTIDNTFSDYYVSESNVDSPSNLDVTTSDSGYKLKWSKSEDGIKGYEVYRNSTLVAKLSDNYYNDDDFLDGKTTYQVRAYTADGRYSDFIKKEVIHNRVKIFYKSNIVPYVKYMISGRTFSLPIKMDLDKNKPGYYSTIIDFGDYDTNKDAFVSFKCGGDFGNIYRITPGIYEVNGDNIIQKYDDFTIDVLTSSDTYYVDSPIVIYPSVKGGSGIYTTNMSISGRVGEKTADSKYYEETNKTILTPKEEGTIKVLYTATDSVTNKSIYAIKVLNILPKKKLAIDRINFDKESPQEINTSINISSTTNSTSKFIDYTYEILKNGRTISKSNDDTFNWIPKESGTYTINVTAEDTKSGEKAQKSATYKVTSVEDTSVYIYYSGYDNPYIHYQIGNGTWTQAPGIQMQKTDELNGYQYKIGVNISDAENLTACFNDGNGNWDNNHNQNYTFKPGYYTLSNGIVTKIDKPVKTLKVDSLTSSLGSSFVSGNQLVLTTKVSNATGTVLYKYDYVNNTTGKSGTLRDYNSGSNLSWNFAEDGKYTVTVYAKDETGDIATKSIDFTIEPYKALEINSVTSSAGDTINVGNTTTFTINTTGGKGENYYSLDINGKEILPDSRSNTVTWIPDKAGKYEITAYARETQGCYITYTKTIIVNEKPQNIATIYYKGYDNPYIHYNVGGTWTSVPGVKMMPCTDVVGYNYKAVIDLGINTNATVCFNNGSGSWDSNGGKNYTFSAGNYGFSNGVIVPINTDIKILDFYCYNDAYNYVNGCIDFRAAATSKNGNVYYTITASKDGKTETILGPDTSEGKCLFNPKEAGKYLLTLTVKDDKGNTATRTMDFTVPGDEKNEVTIYYKGYDNPYIHYKVGNGSWTVAPGIMMDKTSEKSGYTHKITIDLADSSDLTACFNNGSGSWDSNNGKNYYFSKAGTYIYSNGVITLIDEN